MHTAVLPREYFPNDRFRGSWAIFWAVVIAGAVALWLNAHRPPPWTPPPAMAPSAGMDRYMVLWMPEVPSDSKSAQVVRAHYVQWLNTLHKNDYHVLRFSDIQRRFNEGVGLPDRTVVLVFDPGYRRTYETISPLLQRYRISAVWLIHPAGVRQGGRRDISMHQSKQMQRSSYWDVGFHRVEYPWVLKPETSKTIDLNGYATRWAPDAGHTALNVGTEMNEFHGLQVGSTWTGTDLAHRLEIEWPLSAPAYLTVTPIQKYMWGVVSEHPGDPSFSLRAPLGAHARSLYWLGTRGAYDLVLSGRLTSFFGEWMVWLRSDSLRENGIAVGLRGGTLFVDVVESHKRRALAAVPVNVTGKVPVNFSIRLVRNDLRVSLGGREVLHRTDLPLLGSQGMVRMTVYDKIRGAAHADVDELRIEPVRSPAL